MSDKKVYQIILEGCDDSTIVNMELLSVMTGILLLSKLLNYPELIIEDSRLALRKSEIGF